MEEYEKNILRISLVFVILGLSIIYISNLFYEPKLSSISEVNYNSIGKRIKVRGDITWIKLKNNNLFLKISDGNSEIFVVGFNSQNNFGNTSKINNLKKGNSVLVEGEVNIYNGNLEIIADDIRLS